LTPGKEGDRIAQLLHQRDVWVAVDIEPVLQAPPGEDVEERARIYRGEIALSRRYMRAPV